MDQNKEEAIIRLEGLGKQFATSNGTVTALDDINLEICRGEIFGIIGLSGAGKSTLVRCINYLEEPTSGRVIFEGKNLSAMKEKEKRLAELTEESAYAVQMVQNTIDNLQAVNSDIQTTMDEIDTYMQRLNDTRSSLSTTHDKNEKIMQNFAKLLCVD